MSRARSATRAFIVDVPANLLKRNTEVSKDARDLYSTMRSLADGKTGALRIKRRWLKAKAIDAAAEMCRDVRMRAMRELVALGFVTMERERVERVIGGRRRVVMGAVHYIVYRQPVTSKSAKKQPFLLKSISSTVEEIDSQFLSETPSGTVSGGSVVPSVVSERGTGKVNHHHQAPSKTDDDRATLYLSGQEPPNRFEQLQEKAKANLVAQGEDPEFVETAIQFIDERSWLFGKVPATEAYYVASFATLKHNSAEMAELWEIVNRRRALREKYMSGFTGELSEESETNRRAFNAKMMPRDRTSKHEDSARESIEPKSRGVE